MKKVLDFINIPRNIKKYLAIKNVEKYSDSKNFSAWVLIMDLLIVAAFAAEFFYIYFISRNKNLEKIGILSLVLFGIFIVVRISLYVMSYEKKHLGVNELILIDDQGSEKITWTLKGKTCILIGKKAKDSDVDIDLSECEYSSLVSRQHAVLNLVENDWFLEDIGSVNGSGLKKMSDSSNIAIEQGEPYKIDPGDIIYIANTKLLVR